MQRKSTGHNFYRTSLAATTMLAEAQIVIGLRLMGMAGFWSYPAGEADRMVAEKQAAMGQSALAAGLAIAAGRSPDKVVQAALHPIRRKTRANVGRLLKSGPPK